MAQVPLAFSIHNFINSVGADAGFAAIIGLAILVLLYFAHARETANLREEAALLTQRLMQAEARVAQLTRAQSAQPAQPAPAPAPAAAHARTAAGGPPFPFAPAGVGAPALAAATRVVPLAAVAAARPATAAASAVPASARPAAIEELAPSRPAPPVPSPLASGQYERPAAAQVAAPAAATVAGANGAGHDAPAGAPPVAADVPPPRQAPRVGSPGGPPPLPPLRSPSRRPSRLGRIAGSLAAVVVLAGVIAVLVVATSGGTSTTTSTTAPRTTNAPAPQRSRPAVPPFSPSSVTVSVLNGTNVNQLAHKVAAVLVGKGYKQGNLFTAPNQTQTTTVVSYLPGAANRTAALHVATALNLKSSAVQPIDSSTQQVACPPTSPCAANVVVTVGADLSTL